MKTTIDISDSLLTEAKSVAVEEGFVKSFPTGKGAGNFTCKKLHFR